MRERGWELLCVARLLHRRYFYSPVSASSNLSSLFFTQVTKNENAIQEEKRRGGKTLRRCLLTLVALLATSWRATLAHVEYLRGGVQVAERNARERERGGEGGGTVSTRVFSRYCPTRVLRTRKALPMQACSRYYRGSWGFPTSCVPLLPSYASYIVVLFIYDISSTLHCDFCK